MRILGKKLRRLLWQNADFVTKAKDLEAETVYEMYYDYSEPAKKIPDHRILAANRGEKEEILKVQLTAPEQEWWSNWKKAPSFRKGSKKCGF